MIFPQSWAIKCVHISLLLVELHEKHFAGRWNTKWVSILIDLITVSILKRNKIAGFWEDVCPTMENDEFRRFFHMHKETCNIFQN